VYSPLRHENEIVPDAGYAASIEKESSLHTDLHTEGGSGQYPGDIFQINFYRLSPIGSIFSLC